MDFIFGSDPHNSKDQPNSKSKQKEFKVQIYVKDDDKKIKQNIFEKKFKLETKTKQEDHQNSIFSEQEHDGNHSPQKDIRKANQQTSFQNQMKQKQKKQQFHQSFQNFKLKNQKLSQSQIDQTQIQKKSPTLQSINPVKRIRSKVTQDVPKISPIIQKKSNQFKVNTKLSVPKQQNSDKIKSAKVISPKKVQKLVTPIKSTKLISPSINRKQNHQKSPEVKKIVNPPEANKIKDLKINKQTKKKEFSMEVKPKSIPKKKTLEQTKNYGKSHSVTKSRQGIQLFQPHVNNMNYQESIKQQFQSQLYNSERGMKFLDKKLIGDKLNDSENVVYTALASQKPDQYMKGMYENIYPDNQFIKFGVDQTVNKALQNVSNIFEGQRKNEQKIQVSKRIAPKNKDDLKELQKFDRFRLLKIRQGQVKSKVGDLRTQLQKQYFIHKNLIKIDPTDSLMPDYYSMDHPETIKAQNLIRSLKQKRKSQHRQYQEYLSQKEFQKQKISQIEKEYEERLKQERRQKLKQIYEQKHQERELQKQEMKKKEEEFKEWIKMYERQKPLEEQFQEEMVMKIIIPEIQDRHKKLMKIKDNRKPIDIEDINEHEKRYMDFKKDEIIRQRAQFESKIESDIINEENSNRHYKGKYRYLVLESMYEQKNQIDPKEIQRSKKQRQLAYSDQIRYVHQSLIKKKNDQTEDTRTLVRRVRNYDGSVDINKNSQTLDASLEISSDRHQRRNVQTIDVYAQGLKNLQYVKSHVRQKLLNGEQKKPKIQLIQIKQKHSYLDELKEKRLQYSLQNRNHENSKKIQSIENAKYKKLSKELSTGNNIESIKARVQGMDEKLKRKEQKQKHARDKNPLNHRQIENDYLDSINVKLKMVQELK